MRKLFFFLFPIFLIAQNPNDCVNSINLCGSTDLNVDPSGVGFNEFSLPNNPPPTCFSFQAPQVWFKVDIETTGTFSFALTPETPQEDYDFAVFGPTNDCNNLGPAIRCSSTNPNAAGVSGATGLNATETDTIEGPGPNGNGFLRELDVIAGESYFIIIGLAVGDAGFTMTTSGTAQLPPPPEINPLDFVEFCDNDPSPNDGITNIDLTQFDNDLIASPNTVIRYFETENDANINDNEIVGLYQNNSDSDIIYVRAERTDSDCVNFSEFELRVDDEAVDFTTETEFFCSTLTTQTLNLSSYLNAIEPNSSQFQVTYFDNIDDAYVDASPINPNRTATTTLQQDVIKFVDPTGDRCEFYVTFPYQVAPPPEFNTDPAVGQFCDDDFDDFLDASLSDLDLEILDGQDASVNDVFYYETPQDRTNDVNRLTTYGISSTPQTLYVVIQNNVTGCIDVGEVSVRLNPKPVLEQQEPLGICLDATSPLTLEVEQGFDYYQWSNGDEGPNAFQTQVMTSGDFTVNVTNEFGCTTDLTITVEPSEAATIVEILTDGFNSGGNSATIIVEGTGDYEYSIDGLPYQDENVFEDLFRGTHVIDVRDKNGCGITTQEFVVLDFEPFFTPNDDGYNDTWSIEGIEEFPGTVLTIFDRHGKLLYQFTSPGIGWDGTFNNQPVPSSSYWFTLEIPDQKMLKGYFALKR